MVKIWDDKTKGFIELIPSKLGQVIIVNPDGSKHRHPANRAERRRLAGAERRKQKRELRSNRK